jgi:hypothetical protein
MAKRCAPTAALLNFYGQKNTNLLLREFYAVCDRYGGVMAPIDE